MMQLSAACTRGRPLVAGTDSLAGFMLHRELELYVGGRSAGEAIRIAPRAVRAMRGARGSRHDRTRQARRPDPVDAIRPEHPDIRGQLCLKDGTGFAR